MSIQAMLAALSLGMFAGCADGGKPPMADVTNQPTAELPKQDLQVEERIGRGEERAVPPVAEEDLNESQRRTLKELSAKVRTGNSVADIRRLKDSLERWDELMIHPAPAELKPVYMILRGRVQERLAELEAEAAAK